MLTRRIQQILLVLLGVLVVALIGLSIIRVQTTQLPVLSVDAQANSQITAAQISTRTVPVLSAQMPGVITNPQDLVGRYLLVSVQADQPIYQNELATTSPQQNRFSQFAISDKDKLVVFVQTDLVRSSGNVIRAGDYVDVVWVNQQAGTATLLYEKVHVVGARNSDGNEVVPVPNGGYATSPAQIVAGYLLALPPQQAAQIVAIPASQLVLIYTTPNAPPLNAPWTVNITQNYTSLPGLGTIPTPTTPTTPRSSTGPAMQPSTSPSTSPAASPLALPLPSSGASTQP